LTSGSVAAGDLFYVGDISDSSNIKSMTFGNVSSAIFTSVSGDATIATNGALTVGANAIEAGMLNDNCISGFSNLGGTGVADADEFLFSDDGSLKALTFSNLYGAVFGKVSGDATIGAAGALTIGAGAVEGSMLNTDVISAQTELGSGLASDDELLVSDGGTLKRMDVSVLSSFVGDNLAVSVASGSNGATLSVGVNYFGAHGGAMSASLPASAGLSAGQSVKVKAGADCSSASALTISKAGSQTIDGVNAIVLESPFAAVELIYVADNLWRVF
jgi:hypothetical protein